MEYTLPVNTTMFFALPSTDWKLFSIEGLTLCMCACSHAFCKVHHVHYGKLCPYSVHPFAPKPLPSCSRSFTLALVCTSRQSASFATSGKTTNRPSNRTPTVVTIPFPYTFADMSATLPCSGLMSMGHNCLSQHAVSRPRIGLGSRLHLRNRCPHQLAACHPRQRRLHALKKVLQFDRPKT